MTSKKVLYSDNYVQVYPDEVVVKAYYFPLGSDLKIPISDIQHVYYKAQACLADFFSTKDWGMSLTPVWWACDFQRHIKHRYSNVVLDTGDWVRKGFSVVDVAAFLNALQPFLNAAVKIEKGNIPRSFKRLKEMASKSVERMGSGEVSRLAPGSGEVGTSQLKTPEKSAGAFPPPPNYDDIMETVKAKEL